MDDLDGWGTVRLLTVAARLVEQESNARLATWELTHTGLVLLGALMPGPVTQHDLAVTLQLEDQAVSRAVDRLERAGHVRRHRDSRDRRRVLVTLTEDGRTACQRASGTGACGEQLDVTLGEQTGEPVALRTALAGIIRRYGTSTAVPRNVP